MTLTPTLSRRWNRRISRSSLRSTQTSHSTSSTSEGSRVSRQASPASVARASAAVLGRSPSSASMESSAASTAWRAAAGSEIDRAIIRSSSRNPVGDVVVWQRRRDGGHRAQIFVMAVGGEITRRPSALCARTLRPGADSPARRSRYALLGSRRPSPNPIVSPAAEVSLKVHERPAVTPPGGPLQIRSFLPEPLRDNRCPTRGMRTSPERADSFAHEQEQHPVG